MGHGEWEEQGKKRGRDIDEVFLALNFDDEFGALLADMTAWRVNVFIVPNRPAWLTAIASHVVFKMVWHPCSYFHTRTIMTQKEKANTKQRHTPPAPQHSDTSEQNTQDGTSMTSGQQDRSAQGSMMPRHSSGGLGLFGDQDIHDFFHDPFATMQRFARRMDNLFEDFGFRGSPTRRGDYDGSQQTLTRQGQGWSNTSSWMPQVETFEREGKIVVRADIPGMKKEEIEIEVEDGILTIQGTRHQESNQESGNSWRSERSYGSFARRMRLPKGVDAEKINASYTDGVLELTIEKPEKIRQSHRISLD